MRKAEGMEEQPFSHSSQTEGSVVSAAPSACRSNYYVLSKKLLRVVEWLQQKAIEDKHALTKLLYTGCVRDLLILAGSSSGVDSSGFITTRAGMELARDTPR